MLIASGRKTRRLSLSRAVHWPA